MKLEENECITRGPFKGRKFLLISASFFGYETLISDELRRLGAEVHYFDERPSNDFITKSLIRINYRLLKSRLRKYYQHIIEYAKKESIDEILIIRGEAISKELIKDFKRSCPSAKFRLYLWDSMSYNPNALKIREEFNSVYSFDHEDAKLYTDVKFLPLFYSNLFAGTEFPKHSFLYDACFIGTIHTDRYKIVDKLVGVLRQNGRRVYTYYYYPSRVLCFCRALVDKGFRKFVRESVNFKGLSLPQIVELFNESRCVIDINRPKQQGLTMRTIETYGARRKLITTNQDVMNYSLFNPNDVCVVDRNHPQIPDSFFEHQFDAPSEEKWRSYSIEAWLVKLFS